MSFSCADVGSDYAQVLASRFQRLFGIMLRNKTSVFVKSHIAFPAETIKGDEQSDVFLVSTRPHEFNDGDVMSGLASRAESMAEHEARRSLEHGFIGQLKAGFLVERERLVRRSEFLVLALARKRSICGQSTVCGLSFFIWHHEVWADDMRTDKRKTFIVPDVFQKGILAGAARFEFLRSEDGVVDLAAELAFQLALWLPP